MAHEINLGRVKGDDGERGVQGHPIYSVRDNVLFNFRGGNGQSLGEIAFSRIVPAVTENPPVGSLVVGYSNHTATLEGHDAGVFLLRRAAYGMSNQNVGYYEIVFRITGEGNAIHALSGQAWSTAELLALIPNVCVGDLIISTNSGNRNWAGFTIEPSEIVRVVALNTNLNSAWSLERRGRLVPQSQQPAISDTQQLQLKDTKSELEFMIDSLFFWLFRQWTTDECAIREFIDQMTVEEKIVDIVIEAQSLFGQMGLPDDWIFSYIPEDYELDTTQQTVNFMTPLVKFVFDYYRQAEYRYKIEEYRYINMGYINGNFRIKGSEWARLHLHNIWSSQRRVFMRPSGRPDIQQSWSEWNGFFDWPLYGVDLKFTYSPRMGRMIIEGRGISAMDGWHYDILATYDGICRWSSTLVFDICCCGGQFEIVHERAENYFN